jgi:glyoxylase-like metal-dependent hydrolase (beta-lactamase superfamily II)
MGSGSIKELISKGWLVHLTANLYVVPGPGQSRFPYCNSFLIDGHETVMIDAGVGVERLRAFDRIKRIDILIISHSHPDHIIAWHVLKDRFIFMPSETPDSVADIYKLGLRFTDTQAKAKHWAHRVGRELGVQPLRMPDGRYGDGDVFEVAGVKLQAIHAPGHLDDHYCFLETKSGTLLTTDIDFTGFGPWYGNPECDIEQFKQSIYKVMEFPHQRVCSSHKPAYTGNAMGLFETYMGIFDRQAQAVLDLCDSGRSLDEMVAESPFYRNKAPDKIVQNIFEEQMIAKNLEILMKQGRVEEKGSLYRRVG